MNKKACYNLKCLKISGLIVICMLLLLGCQKDVSETPTMGVLIYKADDLFISMLKNEVKLYAQDKIGLNLNDSRNSQSNQNQQIEALISQGVDVLAINLVDIAEVEKVLKTSRKKNKPVIFFNREPAGDVMAAYENCWYVGTKSEEAGVMQGEIILDGWYENPMWDKNGDGIIQYVMLQGEQGHADTESRTTYVIKTIEADGVMTNCLAKAYANWDSLEAKELMDDWMSTYGDAIEVVISNNDAMAIGAIVSLQSKGYLTNEKYMPIVGVDGIPGFLEKIERGLAIGTVVNDTKGQSEAIVDIGVNIINGEEPMNGILWEIEGHQIVRVPYIKVTSDNVEQYTEK